MPHNPNAAETRHLPYLVTHATQHYQDMLKARHKALCIDYRLFTPEQRVQVALMEFELVYVNAEPAVDIGSIKVSDDWRFKNDPDRWWLYRRLGLGEPEVELMGEF